MLTSLAVRGFKSLREVAPIQLAPLTLFFGPNGAGKSNLIDAVLLLSRIVGSRKTADAFEGPIRGLPLEQFSFPSGTGLAGLLRQQEAKFRFEAELRLEERVRYSIEIGIAPVSGSLSSKERFEFPDGPGLLRKSTEFEQDSEKAERVLETLSSFRTYYLDPRTAMRSSQPPKEVDDVGPLGENLAPFLYRLKAERPAVFAAVKRTLKTLVPTIEDLVVDLDPHRGVLDVQIRQGGTPFSARLVSEGTLRVLALVCAVVNPWGGPLLAFEEPENGVHPRRIELIAQIFGSLLNRKDSPRQVILTSHSLQFCAAILNLARERPRDVALYRTLREGDNTRFVPFAPGGPLTDPEAIEAGLADTSEERLLEDWMLRGFLDG